MNKNNDFHNVLNWLLGSVLGMSLFLTACGERSKKDTALRGGQAIAGNCVDGTSGVGIIYDGGQGGNFQNQVAGYVSAWMDPASLGTVDGNPGSTTTGIDLRGKLKFTAQGQLIREQSGLEITITDSIKFQGGEGISPANYQQMGTSGTMNATARTFQATFQDKYGTVTINGQFDASFAWGQIQFQNSQAFAGYSPQSGPLGAFKISKCGLLD
ncbi:MAG: hypothetical protein IPK04_22890 [Bdellovibrionales bacterium]|jgi:hypothetical protein|nr:hypothetical protein [Bdellovibrionales bacterium]